MKVENGEPMKLAITQITINKSTGFAMARIPGPPPKSALDRPAALVLQAAFTISASKEVPGFQYWYHIPGCPIVDPRFVHVSITWEGKEGEQTQLAEIEWPPQDAYHQTFAVAIAHMLTYSNPTVQHFYLK
jgi:hypothetical protein